MLVAIAITAMMEFMGNTTKAHSSVQALLRGTELANAALEYAALRPLDELAATEAQPRTFSPPISAQGTALAGSQEWTQVISARAVDPNALQQSASPGSPTLWVTVTVLQNNKVVYSHARLQTGGI